MFKIIFLAIFLAPTLIFSNESVLSQNQTYFLPAQKDEAKDKVIDLIKNSKESIKISMYNFSYKKFAKELAKASNNGVKIKVILDEEKVKKDDEIYKYLKKNKIEVIIPKKKLHTKIAVFDNKVSLIASLNWTKASFKDNYEILLISKDKKTISDINNFIDSFD